MIEMQTHPEELLDRIASDTATADDLRQFEQHAEQCPACAAHRTLRPMVRASLEARSEEKLRNERAVVGAMNAVGVRSRRRAARPVWLLAAAAVLVTGVAGARYWSRLRPVPAPFSDSVSATATDPTTLRSTNLAPNTPDPATESAEVPPVQDKAKRALASPDNRETAAQVFAEANDERRTGKDSQAMASYRKVERLFPGSPEAEQSYATLGSLLMEHGSPQEALGQFDHYIERGGPLLVDVLAGKATALQRLGRAADERRTWETLLQRFPKSVQATRAKTRLAELH